MEKPLEIVVVDDELIVRKRLKPALEKSGYNVEVYDDGSGVLTRKPLIPCFSSVLPVAMQVQIVGETKGLIE